MTERSLLVWGTGGEDVWMVDIVVGEPAPPGGFRRTAGPIRVSAGVLHLTNYESLTMAAQFADVHLPEPDQQELVFDIPPGDYSCEIVQLHDPDHDIDASDSRPPGDLRQQERGSRHVRALRSGCGYWWSDADCGEFG